jgi:hypothetical protein
MEEAGVPRENCRPNKEMNINNSTTDYILHHILKYSYEMVGLKNVC